MEQTERLAGKVIVVGVTGGIAAFKAAHLVTGLRKFGAEVHTVMTSAAAQFVSPLTFRALSQHPVVTDMWDAQTPYDEPHVTLGERADMLVIAPATAQMLAKLARSEERRVGKEGKTRWTPGHYKKQGDSRR